jgi:propane monooxygenase reductase subunit
VSDTHKVRFEPVGVDIDVDEDETVLDAAFRQGVMLMHGCKEGQCSACKSFLLDGDVQMDKYSTFALADYESDEGYVLLCRAHAYSDLEIELINYDEDMIRSGLPVVNAGAKVTAMEALTHDITRLVLKVDPAVTLRYHPGQYVDIHLPATDGSPDPEHRSFSMAAPPSTAGQLEFMIKRYPGGKFSSLLEGGLSVGDELQVTGPYGAFTLRASSDRPVLMIGGGAGMAPILALLRQMAESGNERPVTFYYGARTELDLFQREELAALATQLQFRFVPCLSDTWADEWTQTEGNETGMVTAVLERRESDLQAHDFYLCGPPPMIDAAMAMLESAGVPKEQIFFDKFTITAQADA